MKQGKAKTGRYSKEEAAELFYQECYAFYIKETTPVYQLSADKNRIAMLFIDENRGFNFLKTDGYAKDIHGRYSGFGGSAVGGNFSKLAAIGGGALFGLMGMAVGAALTYKPIEQKPGETNFTIDSDVR